MMEFDKVRVIPMAPNPADTMKVGILIKGDYVTNSNKMKLGMNYVFPLARLGIEAPASLVNLYGTYHPNGKTATKKDVVHYTNLLLESIASTSIDTLLVADATYYKYLTGKKKADDYVDAVVPCCIDGYNYINVIASINYTVVDRSPHKAADLRKSLDTLYAHLTGSYREPGADAMTNYHQPKSISAVKELLDSWKGYKQLTCDIETTGLRFERDEILTIGFGTDEHTATAFPIHERYLGREGSVNMKAVLRGFLSSYLSVKGNNLVFHNALFDLKFLIKDLYMTSLSDLEGLNTGIELFASTDDSMIEAYLATNSTGFIQLGLKPLSLEYMGDYAEDVKEAIKLPLDTLLEYNAKDCCATSYVHKKYTDIMKREDQFEPYERIFQPSIRTLLKMMMIGLPLDMSKVAEARKQLEATQDAAMEAIHLSPYTERAVEILKHGAMIKYNESHKTIQKTADDFSNIKFNPNSSAQLRILLFDILGYEPIDFTETGQGKTNRSSIEEFLNVAKQEGDSTVIPLLEGLVDISRTSIVLTTFIAAFEKFSVEHEMFADPGITTHWINGGLKLGGTQSGRLSSNNPNLQNLPSKGDYGKLIKHCVVAPKGWVFFGADFNALEDRIGAIISKDEMKTNECSRGFDGHSLRAAVFFPDELPETDLHNKEQVNRIKSEYSTVRNKAKGPSFALQYGCGPGMVAKLLGCSSTKAKDVYNAFHNLYSGLARFADENVKFAQQNGYVQCAFGLRLRTPVLAGTNPLRRLSTGASTEALSASNAVTQSYGMLMNRALNEFDHTILESKYRHDVLLANTIHDAGYGLCRATPEVMKFVNDELIASMQWQEGPIASDKVKMMAEVDFGSNWAEQHTMQNGLNEDEILEFIKEHSLA